MATRQFTFMLLSEEELAQIDALAEKELRSVVNMVQVLVREGMAARRNKEAVGA